LSELDVAARQLNMRVNDEELARRRAAWRPKEGIYPRGYGQAIHAAYQAGRRGDATSISWRVPLPSLNPRFTEDSDYMSGEKEKKLSLGCRTSARMGERGGVLPQQQA